MEEELELYLVVVCTTTTTTTTTKRDLYVPSSCVLGTERKGVESDTVSHTGGNNRNKISN
jgi:hypothetical protein